jgi:hypothetical protein
MCQLVLRFRPLASLCCALCLQELLAHRKAVQRMGKKSKVCRCFGSKLSGTWHMLYGI